MGVRWFNKEENFLPLLEGVFQAVYNSATFPLRDLDKPRGRFADLCNSEELIEKWHGERKTEFMGGG